MCRQGTYTMVVGTIVLIEAGMDVEDVSDVEVVEEVVEVVSEVDVVLVVVDVSDVEVVVVEVDVSEVDVVVVDVVEVVDVDVSVSEPDMRKSCECQVHTGECARKKESKTRKTEKDKYLLWESESWCQSSAGRTRWKTTSLSGTRSSAQGCRLETTWWQWRRWWW